MKERIVNCLGIDINYVDSGNGNALVFIHNGGGFWQIWTRQIEYFSSFYRVIALDLPGFGESTESNRPYTLDFNVSIFREFIEKLNITELILIGNCIGATIAIRYKMLFPERVRKLVLMNICPGERLIRPAFMRFLLFGIENELIQRNLKRLLIFAFSKTPAKNKFPAVLFNKNPDKTNPIYQKYVDKFKEPKQSRSRLNLLFAVNTYTLKNIIKDNSLSKDTLLLWGGQNQVSVYPREAVWHQHLCGLERMIIIENSGHLLMYESPEITNQLIETYLKT